MRYFHYGRRLGADPVIRSLLVRSAVIPIGGLASVLTGSITIRSIGPVGYGLVATVVAIPLLVPFLDLGLGASLTSLLARTWNPISVSVATAAAMVRVIRTCLRITIAGLVLDGVLAASYYTWPTLTHAISPTLAVSGLAIICFVALMVPLSLGGRILLGLRRNHEALLCQLAGNVSSPLFAVGAAALWHNVPAFVAAALLAQLSSAGLTSVVAFRRLKLGPSVLVSEYIRGYQVPHLFRAAVPMLTIGVVTALAYQSDRLVLSGIYGASIQVATYAAGAQLYTPAFSALLSGLQALWPALIHGSAGGSAGYSFKRAKVMGIGLAGLLAVALVVVAPPVVRLMSHGTISGFAISWAFAVLIIAHGAFLPYSMRMVEGEAVKFQAKCHLFMLPVNLLGTVLASRYFGASGPALGSAVSILLALYLPAAIRLRRRGSATVGFASQSVSDDRLAAPGSGDPRY